MTQYLAPAGRNVGRKGGRREGGSERKEGGTREGGRKEGGERDGRRRERRRREEVAKIQICLEVRGEEGEGEGIIGNRWIKRETGIDGQGICLRIDALLFCWY